LEIKLKDLKFIRINMFFVVLVFFSITNIFAQSPIPAGAKLEKLATGFLQPEGPVWVDGLGILFSDIRGNKIYRWSPVDSTLTPYLNPSDSSNGLTLDLQGRLVLTQMAKRRIAKQELNGTITPLASTYNGKKFNSPNDLVVKSDGSIFFTDPDFNIPVGQSSELKFQGIYRISPSGSITLIDNTLNKPNGICLSLDEKKLYVDESAKDSIYVWDIVNDSVLANKRPFYNIPVNGYADGMKVDIAGNIYCTGPGGVWIVSPTGTDLGKISTSPDNPSNCAWGDADRKTLYITAGTSLYRIRLVSATSVKDQGSLPSKTFDLNNNYPNPFNPSTTIEYQTNISGSITMKIFDVLGCEVATLVNEFKHPGTYKVQWDASGMPSGAYFYQLQAGNVVQTKKLVLIR
jgi:gluconolactonase